MKTKTKAAVSAVLALCGLLTTIVVNAAPSITLSGPASVSAGGVITLNVVATDLADLFAYQFDVKFNAGLFHAVGSSEGAFLRTAGATLYNGGSIDNTSGSMSFVFGTLLGDGAGASGSGILATLNFFSPSPSATGAGLFSLANVSALTSALADIPVQTSGISVAVVPEPATTGLFAAGLGAGWLMRRRMSRG